MKILLNEADSDGYAMARRRSARLASSNKAPKPEPALASVNEGSESPDNEAPSLDTIVSSPTPKTPGKSTIKPSLAEMHPHVVHDRQDKMDAPSPTPKTPGNSSAIKPPMSEMHPSKVHSTMAPPSSSLRLGFTDIKPTVGKSHLPIAAQSTPTKVGINVPSGDFTFRFARQPHDLQLGPEAQRMMDDLREEALKIKQDLIAKREAEKVEEEKNGRKIAKAKGKAGRYSAVHMAEFKKMDSIENHPSAFRAPRVDPHLSKTSSALSPRLILTIPKFPQLQHPGLGLGRRRRESPSYLLSAFDSASRMMPLLIALSRKIAAISRVPSLQGSMDFIVLDPTHHL